MAETDRQTEWQLYSKKEFYTRGCVGLRARVHFDGRVYENNCWQMSMGATVQMYVCGQGWGGHQWIKQWPKDEHLIGLGRIDGWLHWTNGEMAQAGVECGKVGVCVCVHNRVQFNSCGSFMLIHSHKSKSSQLNTFNVSSLERRGKIFKFHHVFSSEIWRFNDFSSVLMLKHHSHIDLSHSRL